jgi:hypothetical protein
MTITLTINNQRVVAPDGATILEAARGAFLRDLRASRSSSTSLRGPGPA